MDRHRVAMALMVNLAGLLAPGGAWGCPACYGGNEGPLLTYFITGVLLSVLPLGLIGAVGVWFYRQTSPPRTGRAAPETAADTPLPQVGLTPDGMVSGPATRLRRLWRRQGTTPPIQEGATSWSRHR